MQSAAVAGGIIHRAPCGRWRGGGLSPPDRRLRSASLACGSPASVPGTPRKQHGRVAADIALAAPVQPAGRVLAGCVLLPRREVSIQMAYMVKARRLRGPGETAQWDDKRSSVHALAVKPWLAWLRHVCDAETMTALGTAPP
jgi:hypothetical protein